MIYTYECSDCKEQFELHRPVSDYDKRADCPTCLGDSKLVITASKHFIGASRQDKTWDPAFGKVISGREHRREEAKKNGWIELGNESVDKTNKYFNEIRERKRLAAYED